MAEPNPSVAFLNDCIGQLEVQAARVEKALVTLRALLAGAEHLDYEHVRAMATAVMGQSIGPRLRNAPARQASLFDDDESLPFNPNSPGRPATTQEAAVFERVVDSFLGYDNRPMSLGTIASIATADRDNVATIICSVYPSRFEKVWVNDLVRWRLRREFLNEVQTARAEARRMNEEAASGRATVSMSLFPPRSVPMTQTEAAAEILGQAQRPMSTNEIVSLIIRLGLYPAESVRDLKQFTNSVFSAMSRKAEKGELFKKVAPGTWGLLEWERKEGEDE
jgi:hypothetical protein